MPIREITDEQIDSNGEAQRWVAVMDTLGLAAERIAELETLNNGLMMRVNQLLADAENMREKRYELEAKLADVKTCKSAQCEWQIRQNYHRPGIGG